jgi:hypothetical protein
MNDDHTRAKIVKAMTELLEILKMEPADSRFPIKVEIVQRRWTHWTSLKEQDAIPAILLVPGDIGRSPESDTVGYISGMYPINIITVIKETDTSEPALDQDSDLHYSIESILNGSRDLGLGDDGVIDTRITAFGSPPENHYPFFLKKYQVVVEHEYRATSGA